MIKGIESLPARNTIKKIGNFSVWQSPGRVYVALSKDVNYQMGILLRNLPEGTDIREEIRRKIWELTQRLPSEYSTRENNS